MSRPRSGSLSDADTLRAYERGESPHDLAASEGCTAGAILSRVSRARRLRMEAAQRHQRDMLSIANARQRRISGPVRGDADPHGLISLSRAVDRLAALEEARHA